MTTSMTITADELIDRYEDSVRRNPETAMRMVMWLMLYDQQPASWARDFLEEVGVLTAPTDEADKASQLRKVHRWRTTAEEAAGLPPRGKRGATLDYRRALNEWRRLNRRPSKEDLLAGWTPQPLQLQEEDPAAQERPGKDVQPEKTPRSKKSQEKPAEPTPEDIPEEKIEASGEKPKRTIVELPPEYSPEDYLQKPPPPLADDRVQRGPATGAD